MIEEERVDTKPTIVCQMAECSGVVEIDFSTGISLQVGCRATDKAFPCGTCGRLHWSNGGLVVNRRGQAAFLRNDRLELEGKGTES